MEHALLFFLLIAYLFFAFLCLLFICSLSKKHELCFMITKGTIYVPFHTHKKKEKRRVHKHKPHRSLTT